MPAAHLLSILSWTLFFVVTTVGPAYILKYEIAQRSQDLVSCLHLLSVIRRDLVPSSDLFFGRVGPSSTAQV
ncbi:hypothetical protein BDM02DRAFT_3118758 [Thelephora ganbajun]|uniref:Uncharacterized protein n=1 Tax=Thelephora ganbajun TaxID=370292 RepID=A0ACB6Z9S6_THEGA|nr:hypothetical protein BDM02DRAFT_3118758 [Thelephora ganbajun]